MQVRGRGFCVGGEPLELRGVTYGAFRPNRAGEPFPEPERVARDLAAMAHHGVNAVRVYTPPPPWLLDLAGAHGLRVLAGLCWEQHVAFLGSRAEARARAEAVRRSVRETAGHPAVLAYAIGNEVPASIARWYGRRRIEGWLRRLHDVCREESPDTLVTYVSYPTTEYLELPFVDFLSFNVYLESQLRFSEYLARLHNLAGEQPLVMAELGIDSQRHGERAQADSLGWLLRESFDSGCAGAFVFGWTDEWFRGGEEIRDWSFGLTSREREPKPALRTVSGIYASKSLAPAAEDAPRVSVVCCSYNGSATIRDTLGALDRLDYPDFEVIVVDDGSTDATPEIARSYGARVVSTPNQGLSAARNVGLAAATGRIVAYIDDDAYPDPGWLRFLVRRFQEGGFCGVGGPNLLPPEDGAVAECVANAPGGPCHVLLSDSEAEHIPGCNMAFEKSWLERVGGCDPQFRCAGDDVDLCWRLQEAGGRLGFHPGAVVWHHRRSSLRRYWKQQVGYGKAEALLARKWPQKYNSAGHIPWSGRIYGRGLTLPLLLGSGRVYQGVWGSAPFQSLYRPAGGTLLSLTLLPEWYLLVALLTLLVALSAVWPPLRFAAPLPALGAAAVLAQALRSAANARLRPDAGSRAQRLGRRGLVAMLHLIQPAARLWGRLRHGLDPWRLRSLSRWTFPRPLEIHVWSERWRSPETWLGELHESLRRTSALVRQGGDYDRWDLSVIGGPFGRSRVLMAVEEHGRGRQYLRFFVWPAVRRVPALLLLGALGAAALADGAWLAGGLLGGAALLLAGAALRESGAAQAEVAAALRAMQRAWGAAEAQAQAEAEPERLPVVAAPRLGAPRG
ncbi:MAG TPA: glycosyltransferase [Myxococcota bacterium]|nr:glycosyltransferase [Myxococcota bacterium]